MKIIAIIEKGKDLSYDINLEYRDDLSFTLLGQGDTVKKAIDDFYLSRDEMKEYYLDSGKVFPELEFDFKYDL